MNPKKIVYNTTYSDQSTIHCRSLPLSTFSYSSLLRRPSYLGFFDLIDAMNFIKENFQTRFYFVQKKVWNPEKLNQCSNKLLLRSFVNATILPGLSKYSFRYQSFRLIWLKTNIWIKLRN